MRILKGVLRNLILFLFSFLHFSSHRPATLIAKRSHGLLTNPKFSIWRHPLTPTNDRKEEKLESRRRKKNKKNKK